jgi:hypothetical protein
MAADSGPSLRLRAARRRAPGAALIADRMHRRLAPEAVAAATGTGRRRTRLRRQDAVAVRMVAAMDEGPHLRVHSWICDSRLRDRLRVAMAGTVDIRVERARATAGTAAIRGERVRVTAGHAEPVRVTVVERRVAADTIRRRAAGGLLGDGLRVDIPPVGIRAVADTPAEAIPAVAATAAGIAKKLGDGKSLREAATLM